MIAVSDLSFEYKAGCTVIEHMAFDAQKGECIAVLGNNGAGKSTLIKCLNRILQPRTGSVLVDGRMVGRMKRQEIARNMAYVAQKNESDRLTVFDSILLGRKPYIKLGATDEDIAIVNDIIKKLGLEPFQLRYVDELSGGEAQKVMLARALAQQPRVLLLDEPTSNLDLKNQYEVLDIVRNISEKEGICVIIVIHDINLAMRYCDRFILIKDRRIYACGGPEVINKKSIRDVYGMEVIITETHGVKIVVPIPGQRYAPDCRNISAISRDITTGVCC